MISDILKYLMAFIGLLLLQVLVLNNLELSYYINPYVYPLIILMLPFRMSKPVIMLIAFACGMIVDMFCNTPGMHAAALVFIAFIRSNIIRAITPRTGYETTDVPSGRIFGLTWYLTYAGILLGIHHIIYFFLEIFSFENVFTTLAKALVSLLFSVLFVVLLAFLFSSERKRF